MPNYLIGIGLLASGFVAGFLICHLIEEHRGQALMELSRQAIKDQPCWEHLKKLTATWYELRALFYSWQNTLTDEQRSITAELIAKMDGELEFEGRRTTEINS